MNSYRITNPPQDLAQNARLFDWFAALRARLAESHQRAMVMLYEPRNWVLSNLSSLIGKDSLILSDTLDFAQAVSFKKAENLLGTETECVVYDLYSGLNSDVLCIGAGVVRAGGVLILLSPAEYKISDDPYGCWQGKSASAPFFLHYLIQQWSGCEVFYRINPDAVLPEIRSLPASPLVEIHQGLTSEQQQLMLHLKTWHEDKTCPVFLVTAHRGRGKSTALGKFANTLGQHSNVVVSAASRMQVSILLAQLDAQAQVVFMPPDEIIRTQQRIDNLIIDEAAMLPASQLQACIELADKAILATTTAGYEGTGQGFMLKFMAGFAKHEAQSMQLQQAVRWGQNDLLEQTLNQSLMLVSTNSGQPLATGNIQIQLLSKTDLVGNLALLHAVYGLLVSAHYRTRPADLRQLMEDDNQLLVVARDGLAVYGVLLLNQEGGLDSQLSEEIFMGRRRPQGHLLAQMLTAQAGIKHFSRYRGYRVQRIAVQESSRRQGIGRRLMEHARLLMQSNQLDYLGSSFSLDQVNAAFWKSCGFQLLHIASGKGKSSGRQTLVVLLSEQPEVLADMQTLQQKIHQDLVVWLLSYCQEMYWQDIMVILSLLGSKINLTPQQKDEVEAFAFGYRGFDYSLATLQRFLIHRSTQIKDLNLMQQRILIEKIMLNRDWDVVLKHAAFAGRKPLLQEIRNQIRKLYEQTDES
jgi:tRNA(Met) cytidine acetyltransferase